MNTRDMIRKFNEAFGRPVNTEVVSLTVSDRELLGKLMFEEVVEYVTLGLGLKIMHNDGVEDICVFSPEETLTLQLDEGKFYDPIESADGLGDINVVAHFAAHWHGFNLDAVTREVHLSNMSKLDENGEAIINGETKGYRDSYALQTNVDPAPMSERESGFDPTKPIGKIIKGPNFQKPDIASVLGIDKDADADFYHKLIRL